MHTKSEKWDYVITGKPYGITRMVIVGVIAAFFIVLTIDQLQPGPNKMLFIALAFGGIATLRCGRGTIKVHHSGTISAWPQVSRKFFCFIDRSGKKHEAILEGTLNEDEITILISRINHAQKEN